MVASRITCGTAPLFQQREKLVEGLKEDRLAEFDHFGWDANAAFPSERASRPCQALQFWAQRQADWERSNRVESSIGDN